MARRRTVTARLSFGPVVWAVAVCAPAAGALAACASPGSGPRGPGPRDSPDPAAAALSDNTFFRDCPHCPEMAVIPPGSFLMGSPTWNAGPFGGDGPPRRVTIAYAFAIGVYEVTFDEWEACADAGGCGGREPGDYGWGRGRRPVTDVSWDDAQAYARWLSAETEETYRLPSEAEWEYAARAGTQTSRYWGDGEEDQCRYANGWDREWGGTPRGRAINEQFGLTTAACSDGQGEGTAPVGSYEPNGFGLYDMLGNLTEWAEDCWNSGYADAPDDGSAWSPGDCERRVLRGGTWSYAVEMLRVDFRVPIGPDRRDNGLGFRLVRVLRPPG